LKKFLLIGFLIIPFLMIAPKAEARSFVSVLASVPDSIFHAVTIGTDAAEYVSGKVAYGFAEIDMYADDAVIYFHDLAHPNAVTVQAKLAKKAAKKAAKTAKHGK